MAVIEIDSLNKSFSKGFIPKKTPILKSLSFKVEAGCITGFLGGNGAGKTTTIKCLLGLIFPDAGRIQVLGQSPNNYEVKKRIGFLPERAYFYEHLTGEEFLRFHANLSEQFKAIDMRSRIDELLKKVDLQFARDRRLRQYSKGMLQKIGFAQAIIHRPELVILDEPMSGLDPDGRYYVNRLIQEIRDEGAAVFFSSHLLPDVERVSQNLVVLKAGELLFSGTLDAFLHSVDQKFRIKYREQERMHELVLSSQDEMQQRLSQLVRDNKTILEVSSLRPTLEEVFVAKALKVHHERH